MSSVNAPLVLGGIVFEGFEIPSSLKFPTKQRHHIHKLVGGGRVIDTLGPDPEDIKWSGRFRGSNAASRCRSLESLCDTGGVIGLSWGSFFRLGIVSHFDPDYNAEYEIPYSITFTPDVNQSAGFGIFGGTLAAILTGDIGHVMNLAATSAVASGAAALSSTVEPLSNFDALSATTIATIRSGAAALAAGVANEIAAIEVGVGSVDLALPTHPVDFAAALQIEAANAIGLANLTQASDYAARADHIARGLQ
ncbi:MAG: hypothetical protein ABL901_02995 [Hyphomicrobiaceae bacterium]|nr:hypothetical protein [Hyphomicrobiaceae bacterium]